MRVAVNAEQLLYRSPGGIGRYTAQLLTLLPGTAPGDVVVPFTARHDRTVVDDALRRAGVGPAGRAATVVLPLPRPALYEGWLRLGRPHLSLGSEVDVVHAPSVAVPPHGRHPLVVTVHDAAPALHPDAFPRRGLAFHRRGLAAAARRADLVVTVSEAAAEEIVAHAGLRPDRIRVVPNAVAPRPVAPEDRHRILDALGLAGRRYVLWVGSLEPRKGVGTLVAAMAALRRRGAHPDVQTVLAGFDGWLPAGLIGAADRDTLGPALHQLGPVAEEQLWALYAGASVFAFPSLHEGFGLPVVEAMTQGTPVLASDIPAVREVAGGAARLVPPGRIPAWADAVDALLGDEPARLALGRAGVARSSEFSPIRWVTGIRKVYDELVS